MNFLRGLQPLFPHLALTWPPAPGSGCSAVPQGFTGPPRASSLVLLLCLQSLCADSRAQAWQGSLRRCNLCNHVMQSCNRPHRLGQLVRKCRPESRAGHKTPPGDILWDIIPCMPFPPRPCPPTGRVWTPGPAWQQAALTPEAPFYVGLVAAAWPPGPGVQTSQSWLWVQWSEGAEQGLPQPLEPPR